MKKEDRLPYLVLTTIMLPPPRFDKQGDFGNWNLSMCHMCKYAEWSGDCSDGSLECTCGIYSVEDRAETVWADSSDCWAFRPRYIREDCVDAVGLLLDGWWPDWSTVRTTGRTKAPQSKVITLQGGST